MSARQDDGTKRDWLGLWVTLGLGLAGGLINFVKVPLFFGSDFLFGGVVALAPAILYGPAAGLAAAALAALPTLLHWSHPYAILIFALEGLLVGWWTRGRRAAVIEASLLYWFLLGMPLVVILYRWNLDLPPAAVRAVMTKQALNGVFNAALCSSWLLFTQMDWRLQPRFPRAWPMRAYLVHLLTIVLMAPVFLLTVWFGNWFFERMQSEVRVRASATGRSVQENLQLWARDHLTAVGAIARGAAVTMDNPARLQEWLRLFHGALPDFHNLYIADADATTVAFEPERNDRGERTVGLNFADRDYFRLAQQATAPFMSSVFPGRGGTREVISVLVAPVRDEVGRFRGYVLGATNLKNLSAVINGGTLDGALTVVLDRQDQVVMSTADRWPPLTPWQLDTLGRLEHVTARVVRVLPPASSAIASWQQGYYAWRSTERGTGWDVVALVPIAPYVEHLFNSYALLMGSALLFAGLTASGSRWLTRRVTLPLERLARFAGGYLESARGERRLPEVRISEVNTVNQRLGVTLSELEQSRRLLAAEADTARRAAQTLQRTLDTSIDMIAAVDRDGIIRSINAACATILGYRPEEMTGRPLQDFVPAEDRAAALLLHRTPLQTGGTTHTPQRMSARDGEPVWVEWNCTLVPDEDTLHCVGRDVTERMHTESALRLLADASAVLASSRDYEVSLAQVADLAVPRLADWCMVFLLDDDRTPRSVAVAHADPERKDRLCRLLQREPTDPDIRRLAFNVLSATEPAVYPALPPEWGPILERDPELHALMTEFGWQSFLFVPLAGRGRTVGAIVLVTAKSGRQFRPRDLELATDLGNRASLAIENARLYGEVEQAAFHDLLTGLPNRALFMERLGHALRLARRRHSRVGLLLLDLDNFKMVNDTFGHNAGDDLLVAVAGRLRASVRATDTAARLGGDEFMILCEDAGAVTDVVKVAERIQAAMAEPFAIAGREIFSTCSIGVALSSDEHQRPDDLLVDVDVAMYAAKNSGRGQYAIYHPAMKGETEARLQLEGHLRRATERQAWSVQYQPVVDLIEGQVVGIEALLRWDHPDRGPVPPSLFVPVLEDTGLIVPAGEWMLRTACQEFRCWLDRHADTGPPLYLSVNVSARQLQQGDFAALVARLLQETGVPPTALYLEITERVLALDDDATVAALYELKRLGVRLAVDDFGIGYSSLGYFKQFPLDAVKIDRSFVSGLGSVAADTAIVKAVITFARLLELEVVGEGIETVSQLAALRNLGVTRGQGYYFTRPLNSGDLESLLTAGPAWRV